MSYSSDDPATRLSAVRDAIQKVLGGQSYQIGNRQLARASLKELRQMEKELQDEINQSAGGFTLGQIDPVG